MTAVRHSTRARVGDLTASPGVAERRITLAPGNVPKEAPLHRSHRLAATAALLVLSAGGVALASDGGTTSQGDPHAGHGGGRGAAKGAVARLRDASGRRVGTAVAVTRRGRTAVEIRIDRLPDGFARSDFHGLHIHANDNPANGSGCVADAAQPPATWFVSADGHLTGGAGRTHGDHQGDMPSPFVQADGTAYLAFVTDAFRARDLLGKALILHAGRNNFGNVPVGTAPDQYTPNSPEATTKTADTGNSGDRVACGVVERRG
jgi:Cu-Zn family superoxide dismutase